MKTLRSRGSDRAPRLTNKTKNKPDSHISILMMSCFLFMSLGADENQEDRKDLDKIQISAFSTKLDELNRNTYTVDKDAIANKGYTSSLDAFSFIPFTGFSNNGNGINLDLRGQGINANVSTQVLLNGVSINMLDSSHGYTPLQTISLHSIESIEILPGGGAVMYGNGTRGGVVSITTKRRYSSLYLSSGINYKYSNGLNLQADTEIAGPLGKNVFGSLNLQRNLNNGYRIGDTGVLDNVSGSLTYDINDTSSVSLDLSYYRGKQFSSPVLRFSNYPTITPSVRYDAGTGTIVTDQDRFAGSLEYNLKITDSQKLKFTAYYSYYKSLYTTNEQTLDFENNGRTLENTSVVQNGAYFGDQKAGFKVNYQLSHKNGIFMAGYDFLFAQALRYLPLVIGYSSTNLNYNHSITSYVDARKISNAVWALEKFDFTKVFSITGGLRYENAFYGGQRTYDSNGSLNTSFTVAGVTRTVTIPINQYYQHNITGVYNNIAAELTPSWRYRLGNLYVKYEHGFRSPNPDNLTNKPNSGAYVDNNIKSENYDTFEIGGKIFPSDWWMLTTTLFYTLTHNEIFTVGSPHSGFGFSTQNLELTHRAGIEIASEQTFLWDRVTLSETFTYIDPRILKSSLTGYNALDYIPYTSTYKATVAVNYRISNHFSAYTQTSFNGPQRDTAQNKIKAYSLTDIGVSFNTKHLIITAGIANVFNTFYYTFFNADSSDSVIGLAFLPAQGRSYFIQGRYNF